MSIFRPKRSPVSSSELDPAISPCDDHEIFKPPIEASRGRLLESLATLDPVHPSPSQLTELISARGRYYDTYMDQVWDISAETGMDGVVSFSVAEQQRRAEAVRHIIGSRPQKGLIYRPDSDDFTARLRLRAQKIGYDTNQDASTQEVVCQAAFDLLEEVSGMEFSLLLEPDSRTA